MKIQTKHLLLWAGLFLVSPLFAQKEEIPKGWHLLDKDQSGYFGISAGKAYDFVREKRMNGHPVIVAVIDSGIDTAHEDLRSMLWRNPGEVPGNGLDDDHNGYVDDIYGWNFLGNKQGINLEKDSDEPSRIYHNLKNKWENRAAGHTLLNAVDSAEYLMWKRAKDEIFSRYNESRAEFEFLKSNYLSCVLNDSILRQAMDQEVYTGTELKNFNTNNAAEVNDAKQGLYRMMAQNNALESTNYEFLEGFEEYLKKEERKLERIIAPPKPYRNRVVNDDENDINDRFYGNNNIMVNNNAALHGTFVAGVLGADRNNYTGVDGMGDNVRIMSLRVICEGEFHDKDLALAIRYAVDNGAQIINISFGKNYSPHKKWVDDAVKYAAQKDVLIVHAVGNASKNLDSSYNFPTSQFLDGTRAENWIAVSASGDPAAGGLTTSFTNYGKKEVNVFAPGIRIYTTVPGNAYKNLQGTGTSAPLVAGLAAFLLSYYPELSAVQLKQVIEKSVLKPAILVKKPGTEQLISLSSLCSSGGIINAYEAVKLASGYKGKRQTSAAR